MKAVCKHTRDGRIVFETQDVPAPTIHTATEVLLRVASIGICSSDIHALHGVMHIPEGNIVGHEYSAVVEQVGKGVTRFRPGDRVVGELAVGKCGRCRMCARGQYEFCLVKRPPGWVSPGIYAEYAVMEEDLLHLLPDEVNLDVAALAEPSAICVYGCIERARINRNDLTVIYGMGPIGLLSLLVLKDFGVKQVICVTPTRRSRERYELAKELGADRVLSSDENIPQALEALSDSGGVDCVVDCSGAPAAINEGLSVLRKDGQFVALGIADAKEIPFSFNTAVLRALRVTFSCTSSHAAWLHAVPFLQRQQAKLARIITHRVPLERWHEAYSAIDERRAIKAILYNPNSNTTPR